ncbi:MAG: sigma-70 family RNA polymerase sigma factor [Kiritimatiellae bacterium]|nr:sigma-70 family RNA polymerase sigma factor [Verrucomicrobiota bacterium]MBU4285983.1 sigma-70 family RNA polymerase sigma factor [Verrucomicrobiota bacterium]MBU4366824.1 sigma-70 family RNA polymerase sigma factor [Verrucomicrobiota bacterium]MCG2660833.1 sigma-70 family RNA polymerase sigma factor [Kiritimatiellia bacterium]
MTSTNDPATRKLLERLLRYDQKAWNELVETYSRLLMAIVRGTFARYGFTPGNADVEDMVADVWQNLLANDLKIVRQCLQHGYFLQTLHVLARNRTIDMLRKRKLETVPLDGNEPAVESPPSVVPYAAADVPEARLHQAIETLTPKERTLIALFFLQGKKYKEIAVLTGISMNSIGPTMGRALIKLRQVLQG